MEIVVEERPIPAEEVLRGDERLLELGRPTVRVGRFAEAAVSRGVGQRREDATSQRARELGLPVVRRGSGGSSLLHLPGDLFWSLLLQRDHPLAGRGYVRRYAELGEGWRTFLRRKGLPTASWVDPPACNEGYCLLSSRGRVLAVQGRVLGGASQHVTSRALLHHGCVSASLDRRRLAEVFDLHDEERARLTSLRDEGVPAEAVDLRELASDLERALTSAMPAPALGRVPQ